MFRLVIHRIFQAVPTLLILITLSFFVMRLAPGSPFTTEKGYPPEVMHNIEAKYHLDKPLVTQFVYYLKALAHGDLGPSFKYKDYSVNDLLAYALPVSMQLGLVAFVLALFFGLLLGILAALNHNSWVDYGLMGFALVGSVIPSFVKAPILILIFAVLLHWVPSSGWESGNIAYMVLPVIVLALPYLAAIAKITRGSLLEVMHSPFIRTARAKGLPLKVIIGRHAIKPMLIPVVSYLGPAFVGILTGSVIVEQVFVIPGVGQLFVNGALNRDYGLVISLTVLIGFLTVTFNMIVDILIGLLDPRVKY
ncbi:MAG: oligopeptide ABC transporter permease OppB [Neisseriaceae bacterium]